MSKGKANVDTGRATATGRVQVAKYDHKMKNVFTRKELTVESKFNTSSLTPNQVAAEGNVQTAGGLIVDRTTSKGLGNSARAVTTGAGAGLGSQNNR